MQRRYLRKLIAFQLLALPALGLPDAGVLFQNHCATCHGANGDGRGPAAAGLPVKPADLRAKKLQKRMTDAYIQKIVRGGCVAVKKSPLMPASADSLTDPEVNALLKWLRSLPPK